jgi:hypothetical protein
MWPEQKEGVCPWCEQTTRLRLVRSDFQSAEYQCQRCDARHTRKQGEADAFAFYPADVERAFHGDAPPLFV